jgi:hypothetical protein
MTNTDQTTIDFTIPPPPNMPTFNNNGNGTFTYDDKINPPVIIDYSKGSIVDNLNNTYTYTHWNGSTIILDLRKGVLVNNNDNTYTYTPPVGAAFTIDARHSSMTEPTPGVFEYVDYDGNTTTIDTCQTTITEVQPNVFELDNCTTLTPVTIDTRHSTLIPTPTNPQEYLYTSHSGSTTLIKNAPFFREEVQTGSDFDLGLGTKQVYRQVYILNSTEFIPTVNIGFNTYEGFAILRPSGYYDRIIKIDGTYSATIKGVLTHGNISNLQLPAVNYSLSGFQIIDDTTNYNLQWEFRLDNSIPPTIEEVIITIEYTKP